MHHVLRTPRCLRLVQLVQLVQLVCCVSFACSVLLAGVTRSRAAGGGVHALLPAAHDVPSPLPPVELRHCVPDVGAVWQRGGHVFRPLSLQWLPPKPGDQGTLCGRRSWSRFRVDEGLAVGGGRGGGGVVGKYAVCVLWVRSKGRCAAMRLDVLCRGILPVMLRGCAAVQFVPGCMEQASTAIAAHVAFI